MATGTWLWLLVALLAALTWLLSPYLKRSLFALEDPRTFAALRIALATTALVNVLSMTAHYRLLFSDEGLYPHCEPEKAHFLRGYDPDVGFYDVGAFFDFLSQEPSPFYFWCTPSFVGWYVCAFALATLAYGLGVWSRTTGVVGWLLLMGMLNRVAVYPEGQDAVLRCTWFLLLFARTGHAWSIDSWLRQRRQSAGGAPNQSETNPSDKPGSYPLVPAWPRYAIMLQLVIIYVVTGLRKTGHTWVTGEALHYAINHSRFYRWEGLTQGVSALLSSNVFKLQTWVVHWWEKLFHLVILGVGLNFVQAQHTEVWFKRATTRQRKLALVGVGTLTVLVLWQCQAAYTRAFYGATSARLLGVHVAYGLVLPLAVGGWIYLRRAGYHRVRSFIQHWVLGRRTWLGLGLLFHAMLEATMNLGTFPMVTVLTYLAFFSGDELRAALETLTHALERRSRRQAPLWWRSALAPGLPTVASDGGVAAAPPVAYHRLGRTLVLIGFGYHYLSIISQFPPVGKDVGVWRSEVNQLLRSQAWLQMTNTFQAWSMFAPNPARVERHLVTEVIDQDGKAHDLKLSIPHQRKDFWLKYDRSFRIQTKIIKLKRMQKPWASYQCRQWELTTGAPAKAVKLTKVIVPIPKPKNIGKKRKPKEERTPIRSVKCGDLGRLTLKMKQRREMRISETDLQREHRINAELKKKYERRRKRWRQRWE